MKVASLENCKVLYELSGFTWDHCDQHYNGNELYYVKPGTSLVSQTPAYDLSYLLRKLPPYIEGDPYKWFRLVRNSYGGNKKDWSAKYGKDFECQAITPEDAVVKLAIVLFMEGILK